MEFLEYLYDSKEDEDNNIDKIFNWFEDQTNVGMANVVFSKMGWAEKQEENVSDEFREIIKNADPSRMKPTASITILTCMSHVKSMKEERTDFYNKTLKHLTNEMGEDCAKKTLRGLEPK